MKFPHCIITYTNPHTRQTDRQPGGEDSCFCYSPILSAGKPNTNKHECKSAAPSYLQRGDRGSVSLQDSQRGAGLQAPHSDRLVAGPGRDHGVLVADGHIRDLGGVATQCRQQASVICSPDLNKAVV